MSSGFTSIGAILPEEMKGIKSRKDLVTIVASKKLQNKYWTAIPHKLLYDKTLPVGAKIFLAILQSLGDEEGLSYYGQTKLAAFIGKDIRTIQRYIPILVRSGWLITKPSNKYSSNDYIVVWPEECKNPKLASAIKKSMAAEKNRKRY